MTPAFPASPPPPPVRSGGAVHARWLAAMLTLAVTPLVATHCSIDRAPQGLMATPPGDGPQIVFDVYHQPLPEIPQPNDVATFADPTSRTGRRINVSMLATTSLEQKAREGFAQMEGWGTFAPITLAFTPGAGADPHLPALDLDDVKARMTRDGHDFTNDPVYIVNLTTGVPVMLDMGDGDFPLTVENLTAYWPNDPKAGQQNLLFETVEEGAGLTQAGYASSLDLDFDGVLDHPNTLAPLAAKGVEGVDDLLPWYERETDTLILRPLIPMEEMTEYAVVITDRLHAPDGRVARSPFPYINHPEQRTEVAKLEPILGDGSRKNYYGDIAGSGLSHVAFAWTFTTQPTYEDMRLLRNGLYGKGPFASFAASFPAKLELFKSVGLAPDPADEPPNALSQPACSTVKQWPYVVNVASSQALLKNVVELVISKEFSLSTVDEDALVASLNNIDHFVLGSFNSPYLIGDDPAHEDPDDWFHLNFQTGQGRVSSDAVHFFLAVPKATATAHQPFPTVMWAHGTGLFDEQALIRSGHLAKQGIATFAIDMPGHGLVLDQGLQDLASAFLTVGCYGEWINGLTAGRAHDLNGDGIADSGGYIWTAHLFHNRDNIRQAVLDEMQGVRILKTFDGVTTSDQDFNGDGTADLAGDFDGDGTPDIGGNSAITSGGDSLGGIIAMIHGAIDPYVVASTPISGGGGLLDVAIRSQLTPTPVLEETLGPLLIAVPASQRGPTADVPTACSASQMSLRFEINDLFDTKEMEISCLDPTELGPNMTATVIDLTNRETRCARTADDGTLRIPVPANRGDHVQLQIFKQRDAVTSYKTCNLAEGALSSAGRLVNTFEQAETVALPVASDATCPGSNGCAQYRDQFYPVGSELTAPLVGIGYARQTPDLRRLVELAQASVDPADPINFASRYMRQSPIGLNGESLPPRGILVTVTDGDPEVPLSTGIAFARAAGVVPFLPPSAVTTMPEYAVFAAPQPFVDAWSETPNDVLIDNHVVEGVSRLNRTRGGPTCAANFLAKPPSGCGGTPSVATACSEALFDADWMAQGEDMYDQAHLSAPLRMTRLATVDTADAASLAGSWAPRIAALNPALADGQSWSGPALGLVVAYVNPLGQHVFTVSDPCKVWDDVTFYTGLLSRFLATQGNDVYTVTHPQTYRCLATQSCPFEE